MAIEPGDLRPLRAARRPPPAAEFRRGRLARAGARLGPIDPLVAAGMPRARGTRRLGEGIHRHPGIRAAARLAATRRHRAGARLRRRARAQGRAQPFAGGARPGLRLRARPARLPRCVRGPKRDPGAAGAGRRRRGDRARRGARRGSRGPRRAARATLGIGRAGHRRRRVPGTRRVRAVADHRPGRARAVPPARIADDQAGTSRDRPRAALHLRDRARGGANPHPSPRPAQRRARIGKDAGRTAARSRALARRPCGAAREWPAGVAGGLPFGKRAAGAGAAARLAGWRRWGQDLRPGDQGLREAAHAARTSRASGAPDRVRRGAAGPRCRSCRARARRPGRAL